MNHNEVGKLGEDIATRFLQQKGFSIVARNYTRPWGEIDIVAQKRGEYRFVEVKTIARTGSVPRETGEGGYNPLENVHEKKLERLYRAVQSYIAENDQEASWQLDVVSVELFVKDKKATCELFENVL